MRFETPILTRRRAWYYDTTEVEWLCIKTLDEFYHGQPAEVSVVVSTTPSEDAYRIRLVKHESGCLLWQYRRESLEALVPTAEECMQRFVDAGHRIVYVTLYVYA